MAKWNWKIVRIVASSLVLIVGVLLAIWVNRTPSAPPDEITRLTPEQRTLMEKLAPLADPNLTMTQRFAVVFNAGSELSKLPPSERFSAAVNAVVFANAGSLRNLSALPEAERSAEIERICANARKTYAAFQKLPEAQRREIVATLSGPAGASSFAEMNHLLTAGVRPEDRRALGPAIHIWYRMLTGK